MNPWLMPRAVLSQINNGTKWDAPHSPAPRRACWLMDNCTGGADAFHFVREMVDILPPHGPKGCFPLINEHPSHAVSTWARGELNVSDMEGHVRRPSLPHSGDRSAATTQCLESATCSARCSAVAGCTRAHPAKLKVLAGSPRTGGPGLLGPQVLADFRSMCCAPEVRCPCWLGTGGHWAPGDGDSCARGPCLCAPSQRRACPSAPSPLPDVPPHPMSPHTRLTLPEKVLGLYGKRVLLFHVVRDGRYAGESPRFLFSALYCGRLK